MQWWQWLQFAVYYVSAVCIAIGYVWTIVLFISGYRYLRRWNPGHRGTSRSTCGCSSSPR